MLQERKQAVAAFSTSYTRFRWSEVQILSPQLCIGNKAVRPLEGPNSKSVACNSKV